MLLPSFHTLVNMLVSYVCKRTEAQHCFRHFTPLEYVCNKFMCVKERKHDTASVISHPCDRFISYVCKRTEARHCFRRFTSLEHVYKFYV